MKTILLAAGLSLPVFAFFLACGRRESGDGGRHAAPVTVVEGAATPHPAAAPPRILEVQAEDTPVSVDGQPVRTWRDVIAIMQQRKDAAFDLRVRRGERERFVKVRLVIPEHHLFSRAGPRWDDAMFQIVEEQPHGVN